MSARVLRSNVSVYLVVGCLIAASASLAGSTAQAQVGGIALATTRAVGGVSIEPDGVLENTTVEAVGLLRRLRAEAMQPVPEDLRVSSPLRKVSLRRLDEAIDRHDRQGVELPDEVKYLAGLTQVRYVFVYPEENDIVLAGPGEGWTLDARGTVVGVDSGRPVMLLDDLLVALRTARGAAQTGISCSIDPQPEGLMRTRQFVASLSTINDPAAVAAQIEQLLGPQVISLHGVPPTSHFARVMVAADYRMKRIAMQFEPSPVRGLPSFMQMLSVRGSGSMMPRWWLAPDYDGVLRDEEGLAWELVGSGVQAMTEESYLSAAGQIEQSGRADPTAQRWADLMTTHYEALSLADPVFGQLRNCMDLAIVGALIVKEDLAGRAQARFTTLLDEDRLGTEEYAAPRQVASQANILRRGRTWLINYSGGVDIPSWEIADRTEQSPALTPLHREARAGGERWWWD